VSYSFKPRARLCVGLVGRKEEREEGKAKPFTCLQSEGGTHVPTDDRREHEGAYNGNTVSDCV
jgi:hypothetical protein